MFGRFLPKETSFFDFFEQHVKIALEISKEFQSLVSSGANIHAKTVRIKELEHAADMVTHNCLEALHKTFITPIERDDIFCLISRMDDIVDDIEGAAQCVDQYKLSVMTPEVKDLADVIVRSVLEVESALKSLRNFKNVVDIRKYCVNINHLENEADKILIRAVVRLFDEENDTRLIIKWKEVYENLESATDRCEDVANIIEGVILEHF